MTRLNPLILAMAPPIAPGALAMATSNPAVTGAWTMLVNEGDEFLLTLPVASQTVFVAIGDSTSSDPEPPTALLGHPLAPGRDGMNRALLGPGPVFAKCVDPTASVPVALTAWTPA